VEEDVKARIGKARAVFVMLSKIWNSKSLSTATKLKTFNVKSVLMYGSGTAKTTKETTSKIQVLINTYLCRILNIWWPNKI
jgi:nucleoside phosphorylase